MKAPVNERKISASITLEPSLWEFAKEVGRGNTSYGIRYILQRAKEDTREQDWKNPPSRGDSQ